MDVKVKEVAERIKGLREMSDISIEKMSLELGITPAEMAVYESGVKDFSISFLYQCAKTLGVDIVDIMIGESPRLNSYQVVKRNQGLEVKRRQNFKYAHLAYLFKDKKVEPLFVTAPFVDEEQETPIQMSKHPSQEFDFVLKGSLKVVVDGHEEVLHAGDSIFYNSEKPHGMIAIGGKDCLFLAIVIT